MLVAVAIVFVGVAGPDAARVDRQLQTLLVREAGAEPAVIADEVRTALARHDDGAGALARGLDAGGVVAGELVDAGEGASLHVVVYDGDGAVVDLVELPLAGHALSRDDLDDLRGLLVPDVRALASAAPVDDAALGAADDELGAGDDELGAGDEIEEVEDELDEVDPHLALRASVGIGVVARSFSSGLAAVPSYASSPVATLRFAAAVEPDPRVTLALDAERSVAMTTTLDAGPADTSITRWQADGTWWLRRGGVTFGAVAGFGRRELVVESDAAARAPDGRYGYLVTGGRVAARLGARTTLRGLVAFEPVIAGDQPTMATLGPARRWALELGAAVEVAAAPHLWLRAEVADQRFSWAFREAGSRGDGGAVDHYPSATISIGAAY